MLENWKPAKRTRTQRYREARERRIRQYGGSADWPALRAEVFSRDRFRCIAPGCTVDHLRTGAPLSPAHLKSVGMGGRRVGSAGALDHPKWIATCCMEHARALDEAPNREQLRMAIRRRLSEEYGYEY